MLTANNDKLRTLATQAAFDALLAACHEAHVTICHYDLVRRPNGVDWEPVEELQAKLEAQLWDAITLAQPELKQKEA